MDAPFIFGKLAVNLEFTNRQVETQRLVNNFSSGINTILISPRRWGKSSLVNKAALTVSKKNKNTKCCFIDLFNIKSEEEFYEILVREVLLKTSSKTDELIADAKRFLSKFIPRLSFGMEGQEEFGIGLDWQEVKKHPDEILNLAEKIAIEKKIKLVICIDEFQNIANLKDSLNLQKKLRANWQKHQNVSYCLYGSKRHMMMEVFTTQAMPFYKFGDLLFLEKIKAVDWTQFIESRFKSTGKNCKPDAIDQIIQVTDCHPYYVQQLSQLSWLHCAKVCTIATVNQAHDMLLMQLSLLFQNLADSLTPPQLNFLKALLSGEQKFSAKEVMQVYHLGSSANVNRIKEALVNKEIVDAMGSNIVFLDPMFANWLKKYYFRLAK